MSLSAGTRLGAYEILSLLGSGGMGEVYRARDAKLNRDVAIKVLPDAFAHDPDRLARLEREARTLATLNHPHIAQIYGFEDSSGVHALVLELVEGSTLADRLARGPTPLDEALPIARQIAEALEAAHDQGIVHRDLKPSNIKVRPDGTVKILDFGLAKAIEGSRGEAPAAPAGVELSSQSMPTLTAMTGIGTVVGTAPYMAPEQARGKPIDKRADIWAFGVVTYELLTGVSLFQADSVADTIALVVARDPDWSKLPAAVPHDVTQLLRRCLTKEPRERLRDIGEARILFARPQGLPVATAVPRRALARMVAAAAAASALVLGAIVASTVIRREGVDTRPPIRRFELPAKIAPAPIVPVIAPDGSRLAYVSGNRLRVHPLDSLESYDLGPVPTTTANLFWAPDSKTIGFTADATIRTVPASGGPSTLICKIPASGNALDLVWRADGTILFTVWHDSLYKVQAAGGSPEILVAVDPPTEVDFHEVTPLPGNRLLIVTHVRAGDQIRHDLYDGNRRTVLTSEASVRDFTYQFPGYLLFVRTGANAGLWALPFGDGPMDLAKAMRIEAGATGYSAADDGTLLVSIPPGALPKAELVWVDRRGGITKVPGSPIELHEWAPAIMISRLQRRSPRDLALSPDGRRAVYISGQTATLFVRDLDAGLDTPLTFDQRIYATPSWFLSGKAVLYVADVQVTAALVRLGRIVTQRADGTERPRDLAVTAALPRVSPDGKSLLFVDDDGGRGRLQHAAIVGDGSLSAAQPFFRGQDEPNVRSWDLSPDGKLLAYVAEDPTQRLDVFVTQFPSGQGRWLVHAGATAPRFSPAGGELFYLSGSGETGGEAKDHLHVVPIELTSTVKIGAHTTLLDIDLPQSPSLTALGYDVAPDGRRIIAARLLASGSAADGRVVIVQNWTAAVRK
jgi:hypothetical protein